MKLFIIKSLLFFLPCLIWIFVVIIIDPFNYFNIIHFGKEEVKIQNSQTLNQILYKTIDYINAPTENILLGDSRTQALSINQIKSLTNLDFKQLTIGASKLNELIQMIYYFQKSNNIKNIVIGINFSMFNKFAYANRFDNIENIINNPLLYIFNKNILEACYYVIKGNLIDTHIQSEPEMNKSEFWDWTIAVKAKHWYSKYSYPNKLHNELKLLDSYTKKNNINLTFIIVPHHLDFHKRLIEFGLEEDEKKFKSFLFSLHAKVIDYDYNNIITINKENFSDPIHFNPDIANKIVNEVWGGNIKIGQQK
jgi:hypothetical protein